MAFFQTSVLNKYLKTLDKQIINTAYAKFTAHFHNPVIQENIRNSKEEQYQGEFLIDLFVNVLGYTKNPASGFNLTTEYKNIKDSKKADGAILLRTREHAPLYSPSVIAVIELKGTNTTDLGKIEDQAFGYKNNQPECVYVVISNFEKLRFYIDNAIEHFEFNLFKLTYPEFELLYLCLSYESIEKGLPKKIKEESLSQEDQITKKLYNDYSLFKRELHQNLVTLNPQFDALTLFKKSQKLLDRFLFLFFAEDRQLLPPNSVRLILNDWRDLQDRDVDIPLYTRFKKYFEYLNTGFKGKRYDVFAYNGGLFKPDEILDTLKIDNELLFRHTVKLSAYDFASEVDVNILGHIFENSLNELDEIKARLEGLAIDKSKTKRKKDGVFYTPKYITKYIVDNTIGKLCTEKKTELQINEESYTPTRGHDPLSKKEKLKHLQKLTEYRNWLLQITICDPACGSGAFLNQALNFLIAEHRYIDELQAKLFGDAIVMSDMEKSILENNLFGVDLNEESVEIAKLSLWLRTAQPNRKLNDLNSNIKCGNSLIDDPKVAGDKAFNWHKEFPQAFKAKNKKAWHITCATHNSRYSQRMFENYVKLGEPVWLSEKEEIIVSETIAGIAAKDNLNIIAYNICGDHVHILLVCEEEEVPGIMQKIKSMSARACNIAMGRTIPTMEHAPLSSAPLLSAPLSSAPLSSAPFVAKERGTTQTHLWTQKFGSKEVTSVEQLYNTIKYIRNNRVKHELPPLPARAISIEKGPIDKGACSLVYNYNYNSLVCTIEHAFRTEYKGGFDVVIGNPPYVSINSLSKEIHNYFENNYTEIHTGYNDLMYYFLYQGIKLLNSKGLLGMIVSNYFIGNEYAKPIRKFLSNYLTSILNFCDYYVFEDANVHTAIVFADKIVNNSTINYCNLLNGNNRITSIEPALFEEMKNNRKDLQEYWLFASNDNSMIINKLVSNCIYLGEIGDIEKGSTSGKNEVFTISKEKANILNIEKDLLRKNVKNGDIQRYCINNREMFLLFTDSDTNFENYPNAFKYLKEYQNILSTRNEVIKGLYPWWRLERPRKKAYFDSAEKIIVPYRADNNRFAYDDVQRFNDGGDIRVIVITDPDLSVKFVLALLNSSLINWYYGFIGKPKGKTREYFNEPLAKIPLRRTDISNQIAFVEKADLMLSLNKELQEASQKFQRSLQRKFEIEVLPGKLQNWYLLSYPDFIKELGKKKIKLTLAHEAEWEEYFLQESKKAIALKTLIETTDKEIDQMVYALYGLTEEEIKIVEAS